MQLVLHNKPPLPNADISALEKVAHKNTDLENKGTGVLVSFHHFIQLYIYFC
jgi:hypothetical protein